jgi:hypothetical protein
MSSLNLSKAIAALILLKTVFPTLFCTVFRASQKATMRRGAATSPILWDAWNIGCPSKLVKFIQRESLVPLAYFLKICVGIAAEETGLAFMLSGANARSHL